MDQVEPPLDPLLKDRGHLSDQEVAGPVRRRGEAGTLGPNLQGQNLRGVQPRDRAPGISEGGVIDHDKYDNQDGSGGYIQEDEVGDQGKRNTHSNGTAEQDDATTPAIDDIPRRDGGDEVGYAINAGHEDGVVADPTGRFKDVGGVVRDHVDTIELSKALGGHGDEDPPAVPLKHVGVGSLAFLTGQQNVHLDIAKFFTGAVIVDVAASVEIGDNHDPFLVMVVIQEPSIHNYG